MKSIINFPLFLALVFIINSCQNENSDSKSLWGLWFDGNNRDFVYFDKSLCVVQRAERSRYHFLTEDKIVIERKNQEKDTIEVSMENEQLVLLVKKKLKSTSFFRCPKLNDVTYKAISFSQLSEGFDFSISLNAKDSFFLEIVDYPNIERGQYVGKIDKGLDRMINVFIQQMQLDIKDELNPSIGSDLQEWATIIQDKDNKYYRIYHNYEEIGDTHQRYAFFFNFLPFFLSMNTASFETQCNEIEAFRLKEFQRNQTLAQ